MNTTITNNAPDPVGAYPHARLAGGLLFLSGVGPRSATDNSITGNVYASDGSVASYDIEAQCHAVFANVKAVLEAAGSHWDQLIDVTVYLTNMAQDFATFNRLYSEYFTSAQPTRTTVEVAALPTAIAIELKCIASISENSYVTPH